MTGACCSSGGPATRSTTSGSTSTASRRASGSRLTPALIAGSGLLAERGMAVASELAYAWWDLEATIATPGIAYWLEDVDFDGTSTWHGPVTPVDGGHLVDVGPPGPGEGVEGSNSRSLEGLGQARVARRQRFLTGDDAVGRPGGDGPLPRPQTPLGVQWLLAGQPGVKLGIEQAGWYRVGQPALVAAGLDPSVHPRALRLVVDGVEHALHVTGSVDGRFDPEDAIEFYGEGVDTAYTGTRVYWLAAGAQAGQRVRVAAGRVRPVRGDAGRTRGSWPEGRVGLGRDVWRGGRAGQATGTAQAASFWGTLEQKARSIYFAALRNGEAENWFGPLVWAFPTDLVLTLAHLDPAAPSAAALEVTLQGVTRDDAINPDHTVTVLVNGTAVGDLLFDGRNQGVQTFAVPHALLREGANTVQLVRAGGRRLQPGRHAAAELLAHLRGRRGSAAVRGRGAGVGHGGRLRERGHPGGRRDGRDGGGGGPGHGAARGGWLVVDHGAGAGHGAADAPGLHRGDGRDAGLRRRRTSRRRGTWASRCPTTW